MSKLYVLFTPYNLSERKRQYCKNYYIVKHRVRRPINYKIVTFLLNKTVIFTGNKTASLESLLRLKIKVLKWGVVTSLIWRRIMKPTD